MITFKPLTQSALPLLFSWFCQPHVASLWPEPQSWPEFEKKWLEKMSTDFRYIAYLNNEPLGYIHYFHVNEDDRQKFNRTTIPSPATGSDVFIGDAKNLGKGYGTRMIANFIKFVKEREPECKAIIIDPASDNYRAIACYEKVGFKKHETYVVPYGTIDGPGPVIVMIYNFE